MEPGIPTIGWRVRARPRTRHRATHTALNKHRHHLLPKEEPRKAGQWFCAHHPSTGAEPVVFRNYWPLICTLSLSICLHLRTIPCPCQSCRSACLHAGPALQMDPCGTKRLLPVSALHQGRRPATPMKTSPLPVPWSLQGQVRISSRCRRSQPREPGTLILPPGHLPSAAERGPGGLRCCVFGIPGHHFHRAAPIDTHWGPT